MTHGLSLTRKERITILTTLGDDLKEQGERLQAHMHRAELQNPWFTQADMHFAMDAITTGFLDGEALTAWSHVVPEVQDAPVTVGIIMAGNIPLVGFHDLLCTFMAGHKAMIKLSEKDKVLLPLILKMLQEIDARTVGYFEVVDKLKGFDAVIATGSNNTARYFDYYFGKYPNIIRRNRNAVAVLTGEESSEQLQKLGNDVFRYFGLGCRSVAHLFVPENYNFELMKRAFEPFEELGQHRPYRNNLDYNLAIYILNKESHIALPHLVLLNKDDLISPVGCLYYSHYQDLNTLTDRLSQLQEEVQVVVSDVTIPNMPVAALGAAQQPRLDDYADGVNTLEFLLNLKLVYR